MKFTIIAFFCYIIAGAIPTTTTIPNTIVMITADATASVISHDTQGMHL